MFPPLAHRPLQALPCSTKSHFSRNKSRPESATFWKAHVHSYSRTKRWQFRAQRPEAKHHFRTLRNGTAFKFRLKLQTTAPSFTKKFVEKKNYLRNAQPNIQAVGEFLFHLKKVGFKMSETHWVESIETALLEKYFNPSIPENEKELNAIKVNFNFISIL